MTLTGAKKHVRVLEDAGLVSTEKIGRSRCCSLGPQRLEEVHGWVESYRLALDERLDRLDEFLKETTKESSDEP